MIPAAIKGAVREEFREEIDDGKKNVYFSQFHSSRGLSEETLEEIFGDHLDISGFKISDENDGGYVVRIKGKAVVIWPLANERWLLAYSSSLNRRIRDKLDNLSNKVGWLLDVWIPGDVVNDLFHEYSPEQASVNIERRWDPYWVYERGGEIPDNLQQYYNENYENFVEQEIEFSLKTPKALVDKTLKEGVQEDLLRKSEISESRFTFQSDTQAYSQDGGIQIASAGSESTVTVRQRGLIVHSTGEADATFELLDEVDSRTNYYEKFESAVPTREYSQREDGSLELDSYSPGKVLKFIFTKEGLDRELSIKLSNLLTVGQSDVDIHGTERYRDQLEFFASTYTSYDDGEYEVYCTEESYNATLYLKPVSANTSGVLYIFQKLKEKIDPEIEVEETEFFPQMEAK